MDNYLERLRSLVNNEISENHYTIKGFATRCGISYEEMRLICNGNLNDIRLSTITQICSNSSISLYNVFFENLLDGIASSVIVLYQDERYNVRLSRYR